MTLINDEREWSKGWWWRWYNPRIEGECIVTDPSGTEHEFRSYMSMCWWLGSRGINARSSDNG